MGSTTTVSIRSPGFVAFLVAQALGALNDNALKATIITLALAKGKDDPAAVAGFIGLVAALVPMPVLLFSPWKSGVPAAPNPKKFHFTRSKV
ncbi:hypothetical protein IIA16_04655, partial [bacterium]|nr:hypothetical protein [bacterium]